MIREIIFSPTATNPDDSMACFFAVPYKDFCSHLGRCANEAGSQEMVEVSKYAARDGYLSVTWMNASMLELIRQAAQNMLSGPSLLPQWEEKVTQHPRWKPYWENYCAQQGKTSEEMTEIVRNSTEYGLKLVSRKMNEMIAEKQGG